MNQSFPYVTVLSVTIDRFDDEGHVVGLPRCTGRAVRNLRAQRCLQFTMQAFCRDIDSLKDKILSGNFDKQHSNCLIT